MGSGVEITINHMNSLYFRYNFQDGSDIGAHDSIMSMDFVLCVFIPGGGGILIQVPW